jgi:SNF2 family DNA or RNA helicase
MKYTPHPYQKIITDYMLDHSRADIFSGMGTGKTAATLDALSTINLIEPGPALILAPLRVARGVWPAEVLKWQEFNHFRVATILGDAKERLDAFNSKADLYVMNFENLVWLLDECYKVKRWPFTKIIVDEVSRLKSFRLLGKQAKNPDNTAIKVIRKGGAAGARARSLGKVAFHSKVTRFYGLTGTPASNGLKDMWSILWFIDKGQRLGKTYGAFERRWFQRAGSDIHAPLIPMPHAQKEIEDLIKDVCISILAKDWFKLDETITVDVPVTLPAKALSIYKQFEKEMFAEIDGKSIESMSAASKSIKTLQIASGAVYTDDEKNWSVIHDEKLLALESIIEELNGAPLLIAYHWRHDLTRIQKRFPQCRALDQNPQTIDDWNKGLIPLLAAHPASCGHGINLQDGGCHIAVFSHWWALEEFQQIVERIGTVRQLQSGHPRAVTIFNIRAVGTIDSVVIARRESKRSVQDSLLEAARQGVK